jgi:hypothetical protein
MGPRGWFYTHVRNCHVTVSLYDSLWICIGEVHLTHLIPFPTETRAPSVRDRCKPSQQSNRPRYGHPRIGPITQAELAAARADLNASADQQSPTDQPAGVIGQC